MENTTDRTSTTAELEHLLQMVFDAKFKRDVLNFSIEGSKVFTETSMILKESDNYELKAATVSFLYGLFSFQNFLAKDEEREIEPDQLMSMSLFARSVAIAYLDNKQQLIESIIALDVEKNSAKEQH